MKDRVSFGTRFLDVFIFTAVQMTGAGAVLVPKIMWLMVGVCMLLRAASLIIRPWKDGS